MILKQITDEMNVNIVKVTSFKNKNIKGVICNNFLDRGKQFENLMTLLFVINEIADEAGFPQKATEQRSFSQKQNMEHESSRLLFDSLKDADCDTPSLLTFEITLEFRQAATWQGTVKCVETQHEKEYVSDLDLLNFMLLELETI